MTLVAAPRAQSAVKAQVSKTEVRVAASRAAHTARNFLQACQRFSNNGFNQRKNQQNHLFCSLSSPNIFSISFRDIFCDSLAISRF